MNSGYKIIYSRRRSVSIAVSPFNEITVRCPLNYPKHKIEKLLNDKRDWLARVQYINNKKISLNADIIEFKKIYIQGEQVRLYIGAEQNAVSADGVYLRDIKSLNSLYIRTFFDGFKNRVKNISQLLHLSPNNISVRDYKSRWGCCDGKNNLTFNYKLFMLPENLQDYVIVHELCHTKFHNHSKEFWELVENSFPIYKLCRRELKKYDFLTRLY